MVWIIVVCLYGRQGTPVRMVQLVLMATLNDLPVMHGIKNQVPNSYHNTWVSAVSYSLAPYFSDKFSNYLILNKSKMGHNFVLQMPLSIIFSKLSILVMD